MRSLILFLFAFFEVQFQSLSHIIQINSKPITTFREASKDKYRVKCTFRQLCFEYGGTRFETTRLTAPYKQEQQTVHADSVANKWGVLYWLHTPEPMQMPAFLATLFMGDVVLLTASKEWQPSRAWHEKNWCIMSSICTPVAYCFQQVCSTHMKWNTGEGLWNTASLGYT